jgi:flagellar biosynthesis protein FlhB
MYMNNILFALIMLCVMGIIDISWSYLQYKKKKKNKM